MEDERFDGMFMQVAQQAGGIENILDVFFGFLNRKTDFFTGADEGKSRSLVNVHLEKWIAEGKRKADEDREKNAEADKKRKRAEEERLAGPDVQTTNPYLLLAQKAAIMG